MLKLQILQYFSKSKSKRLSPTPPSKSQGASLSDIDQYLFENFRSMYENESSSAETSPRYADLTSDVKATKRFFVSTVQTGSLIEEMRLSTGSIAPKLSGAIPLVTESVAPYHDFKQSMREMVEAQHGDRIGGLDWDFLEQMLAHYLDLNDKEVHGVISRAFVDLTKDLMVESEETGEDVRRFGTEQSWTSNESSSPN